MRSPRRFRTAREAESYLWSFLNYELLSRYRRTTRTHDLVGFAERLRAGGWRPGAVPTVHVGGTNGKGTVSCLLARILRAGGLRAGLYTSPHLVSVRERIVLDGRPIGAGAFRDGVERIASLHPDPERRFRTAFEHLTALAFLAFQDAGMEIAVIEVGLGGRLDATNVIPPGPAVITPISLDHRQVLGRTIGAIAADKAHILKRGGRGYLMPQVPAARRVLLDRLRRQGIPWDDVRARVDVATHEVGETGTTFRVVGREDYGVVRTRLLGAHQEDNVAAAVAAAEDLLPRSEVMRGVRQGLAGVLVPGRLQVLHARGATWILDGAHNPAAARVLVRALARHFPGRRIVAVVGMAADKDLRGFLAPLLRAVDRLVLTRSASPRAATPERLRAVVDPAFRRVHVARDAGEGLARAAASPADVRLVTGSFVLIGEALSLLRRGRIG